jgi:hypothetical protein
MMALAMLPPPMKAMDGSWVADDVMTEPLGGVQWAASVADHVDMKIPACTDVVQTPVCLWMGESKHGIKPLGSCLDRPLGASDSPLALPWSSH